MGEYIRERLLAEGRKLAHIADQLGISRQSFSGHWLNKPMLKIEDYRKLQDLLGQVFFEPFFKVNPDLAIHYMYDTRDEDDKPQLADTRQKYGETQGSGYSVKIEIDPVNFNPEHAQLLSTHLKAALHNFQKALEEDKE